jgi:hypothetical protein
MYDRKPIEEFGEILLTTKDLDPIYVLLLNSGLDSDTIKRWMLSYWCFYDAGVSSYLSQYEGDTFWYHFEIAAHNEQKTPLGGRWARGKERRHWRGSTAHISSAMLIDNYGKPEDVVNYLMPAFGHKEQYISVAERVKTLFGFGDWIAFKVADMLETVLGCDISFSQSAVFMFKDPKKGAIMLEEQRKLEAGENTTVTNTEAAIQRSVDYLQEKFGMHLAPPNYTRNVGLQEIETILCKWKSHVRGKYPIGNDLVEIYEGLHAWQNETKIANQMLNQFTSEPKKGVINDCL